MIMDMTLNWVEYIGLAAGTLTTAAYLPQVWKTSRSKAVGDISLFMYLSMGLGVLLWMTYGVLIKAPAVIIANGLCLTLIGGMLRMKIKYGRLAKADATRQAAEARTTASQPADAQTGNSQPADAQTGNSQPAGPSMATRLGRGLRQLKERHHNTWGKN